MRFRVARRNSGSKKEYGRLFKPKIEISVRARSRKRGRGKARTTRPALPLMREWRSASGDKAGLLEADCLKRIKLSRNGGKVASLSDENIVVENFSERTGTNSRMNEEG